MHTCKHGHTSDPYITKQGSKQCRVCTRLRVIKYQRENPEAIHDRVYYGGNRKLCLERDDYRCVECGMTDVEHRKKWDRSITVDHIDGNGRNESAVNKNNSLENLQTLCLSCHGKKDVQRRKTYGNKYKKTLERISF